MPRGSNLKGKPPIKPFPKGISPNPGGRPKGKSITKWIRDYMDSPPADLNLDGMTYSQLIALALLAKSAKGDTSAIHELLERLEGKIKDVMDLHATSGTGLEDVSTQKLIDQYTTLNKIIQKAPKPEASA